MGRATYLPQVLRAADVPVIRYPGCEFRGSSSLSPAWQIFHHTASSASGGNTPSARICANGRPDLAGPLCQVLWARNGTAVIIATGRANHAGEGRYPDGVRNDNGHSIGHECENNGLGEPWPQRQLENIQRGMAAIAKHNGWPMTGTWAGRVQGHREYAPTRKIDPANVNLPAFRRGISTALGGFRMDDEARRRFDKLEEITRNQGDTTRDRIGAAADRIVAAVGNAADRIIAALRPPGG